MCEFYFEKFIDVLNIGEFVNSCFVIVKVDDLCFIFFVFNDFFVVYKWEIIGKVDFEKIVDYILFSVLVG